MHFRHTRADTPSEFCNNVDLSEMVGRVILNAPRVVKRRFDKDIEPYLNPICVHLRDLWLTISSLENFALKRILSLPNFQ